MGKRLGRFSVPIELVEKESALARMIMGRCVVVRCEMMYSNEAFEYQALSPDFDEVDPGKMMPEYDVFFKDGRPNFVRKG